MVAHAARVRGRNRRLERIARPYRRSPTVYRATSSSPNFPPRSSAERQWQAWPWRPTRSSTRSWRNRWRCGTRPVAGRPERTRYPERPDSGPSTRDELHPSPPQSVGPQLLWPGGQVAPSLLLRHKRMVRAFRSHGHFQMPGARALGLTAAPIRIPAELVVPLPIATPPAVARHQVLHGHHERVHVARQVRDPQRRRQVARCCATCATSPRPKRARSSALTDQRQGYIGAFGRKDNWLEEWTVFGPESVYDVRQRGEDEN